MFIMSCLKPEILIGTNKVTIYLSIIGATVTCSCATFLLRHTLKKGLEAVSVMSYVNPR